MKISYLSDPKKVLNKMHYFSNAGIDWIKQMKKALMDNHSVLWVE